MAAAVEYFLVSWERLGLDLRASLYYFLVYDGKVKHGAKEQEEEETIERQ